MWVEGLRFTICLALCKCIGDQKLSCQTVQDLGSPTIRCSEGFPLLRKLCCARLLLGLVKVLPTLGLGGDPLLQLRSLTLELPIAFSMQCGEVARRDFRCLHGLLQARSRLPAANGCGKLCMCLQDKGRILAIDLNLKTLTFSNCSRARGRLLPAAE